MGLLVACVPTVDDGLMRQSHQGGRHAWPIVVCCWLTNGAGAEWRVVCSSTTRCLSHTTRLGAHATYFHMFPHALPCWLKAIVREYVGSCAAPPVVEHVYADVYFDFAFPALHPEALGLLVACVPTVDDGLMRQSHQGGRHAWPIVVCCWLTNGAGAEWRVVCSSTTRCLSHTTRLGAHATYFHMFPHALPCWLKAIVREYVSSCATPPVVEHVYDAVYFVSIGSPC